MQDLSPAEGEAYDDAILDVVRREQDCRTSLWAVTFLESGVC